MNLPVALTVLGPPAGLENGGSFADRSPPGMARSNLNPRVALTVLGPPAGLESGDSFTDRSPPQARQEEAGRRQEGGGRRRDHTALFKTNTQPRRVGNYPGDVPNPCAKAGRK